MLQDRPSLHSRKFLAWVRVVVKFDKNNSHGSIQKSSKVSRSLQFHNLNKPEDFQHQKLQEKNTRQFLQASKWIVQEN